MKKVIEKCQIIDKNRVRDRMIVIHFILPSYHPRCSSDDTQWNIPIKSLATLIESCKK